MKDLIKKLNEIIDSGTKFYQVDKQNEKIQIIKGLEITDEKTDVLVSSCKVDFDNEVKEFVSVQAVLAKLPAVFINDGAGMPSK